MNICLTALDSRNGVNPMIRRLFEPVEKEHRIYNKLIVGTDLVILSFIAAPEIFEQDNEELRRLIEATQRQQIPVVIMDHSETMPKNFILGQSDYSFSDHILPPNHKYRALNEAVRTLNVKAYFKRELFNNHSVSTNCPLHPIDWVVKSGNQDIEAMDDEDRYHRRPIDIFMSWGYSSEDRPKMHGELLKQAGRFGAHFVMTAQDLDAALVEGRQRIFALLHTPHFRRIHIDSLMRWQKLSKVSLSLRGMGYKCFRHAEASYNSLMAHQDPAQVKWSYEWNAGNSICLPSDHLGALDVEMSVGWLYQCMRVNQGALYPMFNEGLKNNRFYRLENYTRDYLMPKITEALNV